MSYLLHVLAVLPGLLICYLVFKLDKYEREPVSAIVLAFLLGMVSTLPAIYIQKWTGAIEVLQDRHAGLTFLASFGVIAFSEELMKFAVMLLFIYPRRFFNEPFDGIVYAVLIAMGFATVENVIYAAHFGMETTIVRAFTAVPAHFVFAIIQGYYIGLAKFKPGASPALLLVGLAVAILLHGVYDFLILQELSEWLSVLGSIAIYICLYYCGQLFRQHLNSSPFRRRHEL